jgi:hypothetical protein
MSSLSSSNLNATSALRFWLLSMLASPLLIGFLALSIGQASFYAGTAESTSFLIDIIFIFIIGRFFFLPFGLFVLFAFGRELRRPMKRAFRISLSIEAAGIVVLCFYLSLFVLR